jgi:hypothetical protein
MSDGKNWESVILIKNEQGTIYEIHTDGSCNVFNGTLPKTVQDILDDDTIGAENVTNNTTSIADATGTNVAVNCYLLNLKALDANQSKPYKKSG